MTGNALGGPMEGVPLSEFPAGRKMTWGQWKNLYPHTTVLSVNGREHDEIDPYEHYFSAAEGFRGATTPDDRLPDKESVFVFLMDAVPFAVPHSTIEGGKVFKIGNKEIFLYRSPGASLYASSSAFINSAGVESRFVEKSGRWQDATTGIFFSPQTRFTAEKTAKSSTPKPLDGFDTFWYIWSSTHKDVYLLD